ncbi:MAG: hypothetical protein RJA10_3895 [Pseudomonadota bacterium]
MQSPKRVPSGRWPVLALALALAACGGGPGDATSPDLLASAAPSLRAALATSGAPAGDLDTTVLLDWAEREYPQHFPGPQANQTSAPYTYRFYPATGNHVGVAGEDVYILGPVSNQKLTRVGVKNDFRCRAQPSLCNVAYPRAGWQARLSTLQHGVSGTVTIIDERTVRLSDFNYDGGGPQVYAYLGKADTAASFASGKRLGGRLNSPFAYRNATLDLQLPEGQTLDGYSALSIWCEAIGSSFGSGLFQPPADRPS